jgi:hypothetical protein
MDDLNLSSLESNSRIDANTEVLVRIKPDRRQLSLGGTRRSTDVDTKGYPYVLLYSSLLTGQAVLLFVFVAYQLL